MTGAASGDQARVSVLVAVAPEQAFRAFTEEIDSWWRRGRKYRVGGDGGGRLSLEPGVGGRLVERVASGEDGASERIVETGRVTAWEPPHRLVFEWYAVSFGPDERTEVEVSFESRGDRAERTLVTVTHRGWSGIRPDHPARHGKDVPAFVRMLGMWWADLLSALRTFAAD